MQSGFISINHGWWSFANICDGGESKIDVILVATTSLKWPPSEVSCSNNFMHWQSKKAKNSTSAKRATIVGNCLPLTIPHCSCFKKGSELQFWFFLPQVLCHFLENPMSEISAISATHKNGSVRLPGGQPLLILPLLLARVLLN